LVALTGLSFSAVSHRVHLCRHKAIEDSIELAAKLNSVSAKLFPSITMAALLAQSPTSSNRSLNALACKESCTKNIKIKCEP